MSKKPSISACMIVKDEEELLPGCLESIRGVVDEIIIVDTGSTDKTVAIAARYTGKIYHHPWEDDFARHRNQSLGYADGDWNLIIDADERLKSDRTMIEELLVDPAIDAVGFRIINPHPGGDICFDSIRIFRNKREYRYEGIVHNQLVGPQRIARSGAEILHLGYDKGEEATRNKYERTTALLKRRLAADPEDIFSLTNLAVSCLTVKNIQDAFTYASQAVSIIEQKEAASPLFIHAGVILLRILIDWNRFEEAEEAGLRSLRRFGPHPDILSGLICCTVGRRDWAAACAYGEAYLRLATPSVRSRLVEPFPEWRILTWIAGAHIMTGKSAPAQALFDRALNASPDRNALAIEIGNTLIRSGHRELGLSYLARPFIAAGAPNSPLPPDI